MGKNDHRKARSHEGAKFVWKTETIVPGCVVAQIHRDKSPRAATQFGMESSLVKMRMFAHAGGVKPRIGSITASAKKIELNRRVHSTPHRLEGVYDALHRSRRHDASRIRDPNDIRFTVLGCIQRCQIGGLEAGMDDDRVGAASSSCDVFTHGV